MYKKIMNTFFNELKNDDLLKLPNNFYDMVKDYIKNQEHDDETELKRIKYYIKQLRKLRLYKAFFGDRNNLLEEEKELLKLIEDIEYYDDFKDNIKDANYELKEDSNLDKYQEFQYIDRKLSHSEPKLINTQNDIDIVRVITRFPKFTDGKSTHILNKNDIITLNKKISRILEKHNIVKKINGVYYEDEKKDKKILSIL
ncbi:hypothetical protein [Methanothermococcus sp.]|uniref:hypothetical protein n=1 Tax=Methanothermococcus sp. TaxID=2614238 RepID=UPI0025D0098F|nr:hypothetical protein [Methanothermococcus sp.]